jgi:tetratricopeptide (TPR) repeat protein
MTEQEPLSHDEILAIIDAALETGDVTRALEVVEAMSDGERAWLILAFDPGTRNAADFSVEGSGTFELRWPLLQSDPLPLPWERLDRMTQFSLLFRDWSRRELDAQSALTRGEIAEAEAIFHECLERARQIEVGALVADSYEGLLRVAEKRGDPREQRSLLTATLEASRAAGLPTVRLARRSAMLELDLGRPQEAERELTALIEPLTAAHGGDLAQLCHCLVERAHVLRSQNRWDDALRDLDSAEDLAAGLPELVRRDVLVNLLTTRAQVLSSPFNPLANHAAATDCCARMRLLGVMTWTADLVEAGIARDAGDWPASAARALQGAERLAAQGWRQGASRCRLMAAEALIELGDVAATSAALDPALAFFTAHGPPDLLARAQLLAPAGPVARAR